MTLMLMAGTLPALVYVYELDTEFSGATEPVGPSPWATASFTQIDPNTVKLELSNFNLTDNEFIGAWYLNYSDDLNVNDLNFNRVGGNASAGADISTGKNSFKADGDGFFDILFDFPRFSSGRTASTKRSRKSAANPQGCNCAAA